MLVINNLSTSGGEDGGGGKRSGVKEEYGRLVRVCDLEKYEVFIQNMENEWDSCRIDNHRFGRIVLGEIAGDADPGSFG